MALIGLMLLAVFFWPIGRVTLVYIGPVPVAVCGSVAAAAYTAVAGLLGAWMGRRGRTVECRAAETQPCRCLPLRLAHLALSAAGQIWVGLSLLLFIACFWAIRTYENISLEEVVFYASMPLQGTSQTFIHDVTVNVIVPWAAAFGVLEALMHIRPRRPYRLTVRGMKRLWVQPLPLRCSGWALAAVSVALYAMMFVCADRTMDAGGFIASRVLSSPLIEEEYVDPRSVDIVFPEEKRNLICIFIESAETSAQDRESGGLLETNLIPEMTELARANVSFSQSERLEGAAIAPACGWTIAGLLAETGGLPLKLFRYEDYAGEERAGTDNMADSFAYFLPGATTLGDLLKEQGYRNVFMAGSDFTFGGRRLYFTQHGDYEIWDLLTARELGKIPQDYEEGWGFEDQKLYAFAKEKLLELSEGEQPFHFCMLTVDTHDPGYVCPLCPQGYDSDFARVTACSSKQVAEFVAWCQEQDFYEHTTIAIMGDHASMTGGFYPSGEGYDKHNGSSSRLVYNAFINAAAEPLNAQNRLFTTLDFFPTLLASIGVNIEGERLALGANLFSDAQTLAEKYGYEELFRELGKKSIFYNRELLYP
ncbi:MAG: LTA synthase family protein [Clostridia bacterium]|nr:LTA synthase family protein [Clostridia bacterium]